MKKLLNILKVGVTTVLFLCMSTIVFAEGTDVKELPIQSDKSINKPWTVKFNSELDGSTINSNNVLVKTSSGKVVKATIVLGKDNKSLMIYPPVGGYVPGSKYSVELSTAVKSKLGGSLDKLTKMSFTTSKQYEDSTSYTGLPSIKAVDIAEKPIIQNKSINFNISASYTGSVQYRAFLFKYTDETLDNSSNSLYSSVTYTELTKGYTSSMSGTTPYLLTKADGLGIGKYKLMVYIKDSGRAGESKDANTDYDNYYTTYFKVLDKSIIENVPANATIAYTNYTKTLNEAVKAQFPSGGLVYSESSGWMNASSSLAKYYMDPNNFLDGFGIYQFLTLNYMDVASEDLDNLLKGKGVLDGKGAIFLQAAKENDINPIYLVSHALLETGNGTSKLAIGIDVSSVDGKVVPTKKTYNMFGVHAYDENPDKYGSEYAYTQGWFTVDAAILGGAKYIGTNYINRVSEKQNTLYKMKWDINYTSYPHQYATDIGWPRKQIQRIKDLVEQCKTAKPVFEIPKFK